MTGFDWDEFKNRINQEAHGVSFEEAQRVFDDPHRIIRVICSMKEGKSDSSVSEKLTMPY